VITTPILTFDEVVKDLGIGKARLDSILKIMRAGKPAKRKVVSASPTFALKRKNSKSRAASAKSGARKNVR